MPGQATEMAVIKALAGLAHHPDIVAQISGAAATGDEQLVATLGARVVALKSERAKIKRTIANAAAYICANKGAKLARVLTEKVEKLSAKDDAITGELVGLDEKISNATATLPAPDKIAQALTKFEELVTHLPSGRLKQLIRLLVEDIKVDRIVDRNHSLYRGLARASRLVRLKISLSATGVRFVAQAPTSSLASTKHTRPGKKSIATITVVFEIRRCGTRGNSVHIIDPKALDSNVVAFALDKEAAKSSVNAPDQTHPIFLAKKASDLRRTGMLKKDIAATLDYSAGYVTYLFRILNLPLAIQETLADPLNGHLRAWFGIARLITLAAKRKGEQLAAFEAMSCEAPNLLRPVDHKK